MKLTIASGGSRTQHFSYWLVPPTAGGGYDWRYLRELVVPPLTQVTAPDDLSAAQITDVTTQLRQAGFVTPAEVVSGKPYPGSYSFS